MTMRKKLVGDEDLEYYGKLWGSIEHEFFKLETFQTYDISLSPGWEEFERGEIDQTRKLLRELLMGDSSYRIIKEKNVKFYRLHIVELPLSKYLRYEIESYNISIELGEEIYFISKEEVFKLKMSVLAQDMLLFDEKVLILQRHNQKGEYQDSELLENKSEVQPYVLLKKKLLLAALPMNEFLQSHKYI